MSGKETDGQSVRETVNRYNSWSVFSSNQLDKWIRKKQNNRKTKQNRKWHDLEFGFCAAEAGERDRGRSNGVIRVGR